MMKQDDLLSGVEEENASYVSGPVECLGMTFDNDEKRREYFTGLLREKLKDPEFRKIEGFPIGEDEDILNLSDPPYYTACPNPFIGQFVKLYGKRSNRGQTTPICRDRLLMDWPRTSLSRVAVSAP